MAANSGMDWSLAAQNELKIGNSPLRYLRTMKASLCASLKVSKQKVVVFFVGREILSFHKRNWHLHPEITPAEIRKMVLRRIATLENDQEITAKAKRCKDQIIEAYGTPSQYYYFGRQTARIIDDVNALTDEIRQNDYSKRPTTRITDNVNTLQDEIRDNGQIADANSIANKKICIGETAGRIMNDVNELADKIRRKGLIGIEDIQVELDIIRKSTAKLTDRVKTLREEVRQEHHIVDDGDIAEELGYIRWSMAELMDALNELRIEMRRQENKQNEEVFPHVWDNKNAANGAHSSSLKIKYGKSLTDTGIREKLFSQKPVDTKRSMNIVIIRKEISGDDAHQHSKKTKHIATYDLAREKRPTYGNMSALLCELCINKKEAVNWCETCNSNICVSCTCFHKDVRMMMNHRIFNLP